MANKLSTRLLDWGVGIATVPALTLILAVSAAQELGRSLGQNSEEIFRGDRLPTLPGVDFINSQN
jgi:hypothetical protein